MFRVVLFVGWVLVVAEFALGGWLMLVRWVGGVFVVCFGLRFICYGSLWVWWFALVIRLLIAWILFVVLVGWWMGVVWVLSMAGLLWCGTSGLVLVGYLWFGCEFVGVII